MHRPGSNPLDMQMADFLCDFCASAWREDVPFVEGHHGSCICGACLRQAISAASAGESARQCTMCLEMRDPPGFASPLREAWICQRCIDQAATVLGKDRSAQWKP